jgi:phospholipid/cholesterol/gamma-HCH transport system substrate-binding protein
MSILSAPEFKVGLFVLIVSGIIATMSLKVSQEPGFLGTSKRAWFYIDDASGLVKNSNVRSAGINVGIIKNIKLENGEARVEMLLDGDLPMTKSARIEIRPNGILGDKHIEVIAGDPRDPPLRDDEQILVVDDRASVDRLIAEVSKITKSLSAVAENIKSATEGDADKPLGRIVANIDTITRDLAQLTTNHKDQVGDILQNLQETTDTVNELINDQSDEGFRASWRETMHSLRRIEGSIKNVEEITGKINRGEGTLGKLVNDESTVEELNTAISGVNNLIDASNKLQSSIDFNSYYLAGSGSAKSVLSLKLQPGLDRFYEIGVIADGKGVAENTVTKTTTGGVESTVTEQKRYESRIKLNALFAKNFYDFTVKGGVIENTGGFGLDYYTLRRKLKLTLEAFDFTHVNLRASARVNLYSGFYLTAGGEDLLSKVDRASGFVGAGLFLTNDDLKLLVSRLPF